MNAVKQNLAKLKARNYVRKADPDQYYWFDFSFRQMQKKRKALGDSFYLLIYGSSDENDFFVIPYEVVKSVFIEDNLVDAKEGDNRKRWIGNIKQRQFRITHTDVEFDLTGYYGNRGLLALAAGDEEYLQPDEADSPPSTEDDDGPFVPTAADLRKSVMRQIMVRRGQRAFRDALRSRYGDECMISGCRLMDVVEAAHIKPYRGDVDNHASNGLLLRADLHTLFDLDLIGIEPHTFLVRVHPNATKEGYGTFEGKKLRFSGKGPSAEALALRWEQFNRRANEKQK